MSSEHLTRRGFLGLSATLIGGIAAGVYGLPGPPLGVEDIASQLQRAGFTLEGAPKPSQTGSVVVFSPDVHEHAYNMQQRERIAELDSLLDLSAIALEGFPRGPVSGKLVRLLQEKEATVDEYRALGRLPRCLTAREKRRIHAVKRAKAALSQRLCAFLGTEAVAADLSTLRLEFPGSLVCGGPADEERLRSLYGAIGIAGRQDGGPKQRLNTLAYLSRLDEFAGLQDIVRQHVQVRTYADVPYAAGLPYADMPTRALKIGLEDPSSYDKVYWGAIALRLDDRVQVLASLQVSEAAAELSELYGTAAEDVVRTAVDFSAERKRYVDVLTEAVDGLFAKSQGAERYGLQNFFFDVVEADRTKVWAGNVEDQGLVLVVGGELHGETLAELSDDHGYGFIGLGPAKSL